MTLTLAFDVYGTLIDPHAIVEELRDLVGAKAQPLSTLWRDKQLEYSFRRGLMGAYQDFSVVTRDGLNYASAALGVSLTDGQKSHLMDHYRRLDAFSDAGPSLASLRSRGHKMFAFSNGRPSDLSSLLKHADIDRLLDGVVSVHDVKSFKPDPRVYRHFNDTTGSDPARTWLISSNPFDVIGAVSFGWRAAWVQRSAQSIFDPWEFEPAGTISSLDGLSDLLV